MAVAIVAAYLIGSIPFALILARRYGADLRLVGSGNLGATNVMRASGVTAGLIVALLDMAKGAASVWIAEQLGPGPLLPAAAGVAAIVGHVYPIWLRFRGGKGVATACGVFSMLTPLALPPALGALPLPAPPAPPLAERNDEPKVVLPPVAPVPAPVPELPPPPPPPTNSASK